MTAGVDRREPIAELTLPSAGAALFAPDETIRALRKHPRFTDAVRAALDGLSEIYGGNRFLNRVMNDRGRVIGALIALYLHSSPRSEGGEAGLTVRRFQAFCVNQRLCSFGRARALLTLMCFAGYLVSAPDVPDRRQRRLIPTERLINLHQQRWRCLFEAMALVMPEGRKALEVHHRPEFVAAFMRHLGARGLAGFRLLHYAPDLSLLVESNAGLLVVVSLFLSAKDGVTPEGAVVQISISALAARFGVSRAHIRTLLAAADAAGLVRRTEGSTAVIILPRLNHAVNEFFASLFALLAYCASAAADEVTNMQTAYRL